MELIDYVIQNYRVGIGEIKESTVHLVVNHEGEEKISIFLDEVILHNCTIRNITSENNSWENYFKIFYDKVQNGVVIRTKLHQAIRLTKKID